MTFPKHSLSIFTIISLVMIAACGGGSSDSGADSDPTPTPAAMRSVVAISDSLGTGFGIATPWPTRLANALGIPVDNNSVSGEQTPYGLEIIEGLLNDQQPSHVVIMLGTNDAIRGSVSNAIANLQQMVNIAQSRNVIAIVVTLPPITNSASQNSRAAQISDGIRGLANATTADVRAVMTDDLIVDGVHPGAAGQQLIADVIAGRF